MLDLIFKDVSVVNGDEVLEKTSIAVKEDEIVEVGEEISDDAREVIECEDLVAIPGLINSHAHMEMSALEDVLRSQSSKEMLLELLPIVQDIWDGDRQEMVETGYQYACYKFLENGITTVNTLDDRPETGVEIVGESGMRAVMGFSPGDLFLNTEVDEIVEREKRFIEKYKGAYGGRITPSISCQGDLYCSEELWQELSSLRKEHPEIPFHTHIMEMPESNQMAQAHGYNGTIDLLKKKDLLGEKSVLAHFTHASEEQLGNLAKTKTGLAHCPSVLGFDPGSSWPKLDIAEEENIDTGLGLDDHYFIESQSLFQEAREARQKLEDKRNYNISYQSLFRKITLEAATAIGLDNVGAIKEGMKADIVLIDRDLDFSEDIYRQIIERTETDDIREVFVAGQRLVKEGEVTSIDREEVKSRKKSVESEFRDEIDQSFYKTRKLIESLKIIDYRVLKLLPQKLKVKLKS